MNARRLLIFSVAMLLLAPMATMGGGGREAETEDIQLELWHRWTGGRGAILRRALDVAEERSGVKVRDVSVGGTYLEITQRIVADLAAGRRPPDMILAGLFMIDFTNQFIGAYALEDFADTDDLKALLDRYIPEAVDTATFDGKTLAVPFAFSTPVVYYNADLFREAGLNPDTPPTTWDEALEVARRIRQATGSWGFFVQMLDQWPINWFLISNGAEVLQNGRVDFTSPEAVEAIQTWMRFYAEGLAPVVDAMSGESAFVSGEIGMFWGSVMRVGSMLQQADFDLRTMKLPAFGDKRVAGPPGGAHFMFLTADRNRQRAALRFVNELISHEAINIFIETGYISPLQGGTPVMAQQQPALDTLPGSTPWIRWPGDNLMEIESRLLDWMNRMMNEDPAAIPRLMQEMEREIQRLMP